MKVTYVSGSPREISNTDFLIRILGTLEIV